MWGGLSVPCLVLGAVAPCRIGSAAHPPQTKPRNVRTDDLTEIFYLKTQSHHQRLVAGGGIMSRMKSGSWDPGRDLEPVTIHETKAKVKLSQEERERICQVTKPSLSCRKRGSTRQSHVLDPLDPQSRL